MKVLAIDTSSLVASAAVMDDEKMICEYTLNHKKTHSQKLMPIIKSILEECEIKLDEIDLFAVTVGPGSFTGLRIGVSTAKGLAHSVDKPMVGVCTLDALAFSVPYFNGIICPILDAKREQVYTALYQWEDSDINICSEYMAISIEELLIKLVETGKEVIFMGDGVFAYKDVISNRLGDKAKFMPKHGLMQRASLVAELGIKKYSEGQKDDYLSLVPFYLRKSQAERMLDMRES